MCIFSRWMILAGLFVEVIACSWLMGWLLVGTIVGMYITCKFFAKPFSACVHTIESYAYSGFPVVTQFVMGTAVVVLTEPVFLGCGVSLLSKVLQPGAQGIGASMHYLSITFSLLSCLKGLGHGVRRSLSSLATVLGSLWAAGGLQLDRTFTAYSGEFMQWRISNE